MLNRFMWSMCVVCTALFVWGCAVSKASCGPTGCSTGPVVVSPQVQEVFTWKLFLDDKSQIALMTLGVQSGVYNFKTETYHLFNGGRFDVIAPCPIQVPEEYRQRYKESLRTPSCKCPPGACKCPNCNCQDLPTGVSPPTGVIRDLIGPPRTIINGVEVQPSIAFEALDATLPDDSGKCWITVIDRDTQRLAGVMAQIRANPDSQKFNLQDVDMSKPMEAWMIGCGFKVGSETTIYAQSPNGKVLWREDTYDPIRIKIALRKTDPNYDPNKDPDLSPKKPTPSPGPTPDGPQPSPLDGITPIHYCCGGLAAALAFVIFKKKD